MILLPLVKYNNYYNRIVKRTDKILTHLYAEFGGGNPYYTDIDFYPNDGVNTTQVLNDVVAIPDYLIVYDDDGREINSRWFVIEAKRTREEQYILTLHRDLIVDYYNLLVFAPAFIEKATLDDNDPMIFNPENMTFNQIKQSEKLLQDETESAWIVGYYDSKDTEEKTISAIYDADPDLVFGTLTDYEYAQYISTPFKGAANDRKYWLEARYKATDYAQQIVTVCCNENGAANTESAQGEVIAGSPEEGLVIKTQSPSAETPSNYIDFLEYSQSYILTSEMVEKTVQRIRSDNTRISAAMANYFGYNDVNSAAYRDFMNQIGKLIYISDQEKYYRVSYSRETAAVALHPQNGTELYQLLNSVKPTEFEESNIGDPNLNFLARVSYNTYKIRLIEVSMDRVQTKISPTRRHLNDAPYDMFAIPFTDGFEFSLAGTTWTNESGSAFSIAMEIAKTLSGAGMLYDLQILPYCPIRRYIKNDGSFDLTGAEQDKDFNLIQDQQSNYIYTKSVILWAEQSTFSFDIPQTITVYEPKIEGQTDFCRICSPNYSGLFEFVPAKNRGVDYFNVDCTYKPYNPYIHINPNFKWLYGRDFDDSRGLVVGGDFSMPIVSDAWETYALQNKNFQQMFDREIQSMELQNQINRTREIVGAVVGSVQGGAGGAAAGSMLGGGVGSVIGGIAGTALSAAGGIADIAMADQLRQEALDYKRDMFGYQLGNIQALPNSIAKVSALTANNKIFPFLEFYSCTEQEKDALRAKIQYNGMTVMRIGNIGQYLRAERTYIKARLIRIETVEAEFHEIEALAEELYKGAYFE